MGLDRITKNAVDLLHMWEFGLVVTWMSLLGLGSWGLAGVFGAECGEGRPVTDWRSLREPPGAGPPGLKYGLQRIAESPV